jgi:ABC-type branched-subunit amino acid transport system substrate-binding protein
MNIRRRFQHLFILFGLGLAVITVGLYVFLLRGGFYHSPYELRSKIGAAWQKFGFTVALVWPDDDEMGFPAGARLALEELNRGKSPLAGKMRLRRFVETSGNRGVGIAERVVRHIGIVAVLGHETSASAVPASLIYEENGILFLTPTSTDPRLTTHGFHYLFRLTPDDRENADALVQFAKRQKYKRIGVLYARTEYGESLAPFFVSAATDAGMQIAFCRSYLPSEPDFRPMVAEIREESFDAILIADQAQRAARLIADFPRMGITQPVLGSDKMDSDLLWHFAGAMAGDIYVASAENPSAINPAYESFKRRFRDRFGIAPGYSATQGYISLTLLADAVLASNTADPLIVASTLHWTKSWAGLFGNFSFDNAGDVLGREIFIKHMDHGTLDTVALLRNTQP